MSLPTIPSDSRLATRPIHPSRAHLWQAYEVARDLRWTPAEIDMSKDVVHYNERLSDDERSLINHVLAFFAEADGIVNVNIVSRFREEVPYLEAKYFYDEQVAMENIHADTYSLMIDSLVSNPTERDKLSSAAKNMPVIGAMTDYMERCIASDAPHQERLLMMACVEGIFFSGAFCVIYWFQSRGLMPGLSQSNEFIARDEGMHTEFALMLCNMFDMPMKSARVREIVDEAVSTATKFIIAALPQGMPGMTAQLMTTYIKFVANVLVSHIDVAPLYDVVNPFPFMEQINMQTHVNFFEKRATEYKKGSNAAAAINYDVAF